MQTFINSDSKWTMPYEELVRDENNRIRRKVAFGEDNDADDDTSEDDDNDSGLDERGGESEDESDDESEDERSDDEDQEPLNKRNRKVPIHLIVTITTVIISIIMPVII